MNLSILIPLFNEEKTIVEVIDRIINNNIEQRLTSLEVIIINDGSSDNSQQEIQKCIEKYPSIIKSIINSKNIGKGASIRKALKIAKGDTVLFQDADLELFPEDIPKLISAMQSLNVDLINGSRYLPGTVRTIHSFKRYLANYTFSLLTSLLIDARITDMACGYKLVTKNLLDKLDLKEDRFGFEAELIIKSLKIKKNTVAEVPIRYQPRSSGNGKKFKNSDGLKILFTIVRIGLFFKR